MSGEQMQGRPGGPWKRLMPQPEAFGVTWERCWRHRRNHGVPLLLALVYGWFDARAVRRMESA